MLETCQRRQKNEIIQKFPNIDFRGYKKKYMREVSNIIVEALKDTFIFPAEQLTIGTALFVQDDHLRPHR